jgi:phosphate transport system protein
LSANFHLEQSLQRDINLLRSKVAEMADLGERALKASLRALVERDRQLAYSVILRDQYLDELETELNRLCLEFIVRQQPVAGHLRFVFTTIQINKELERIGDYAESIARQVLAISGLEPQPPCAKFIEIGNVAMDMLRDAVRSFLESNAELAWRTMALEERGNSIRDSINAELAELVRAGRLPAAAVAPLTTIARRFERVSDQAKNLCEEVLYMCTGEFAKHKGAEAFRVLFLDPTGACLSQMAQGIATSLGQRRFVFNSAGVAPQPLDPRAVAFMAGKGIDISRQISQSLEQVPGWEHSQVIVGLAPGIREAIPAGRTKTIFLTWAIQDPSTVTGPPEAIQSAFESAYRSLDTHIRELVGAVLQEPHLEAKP